MGFTMCPKMEAAFSLLGKRWNGLIIHVLLDGPKRFKDLTEMIPMISQKMLAERLKELEHGGIVERQVLPETPVKVIYQLTKKERRWNLFCRKYKNGPSIIVIQKGRAVMNEKKPPLSPEAPGNRKGTCQSIRGKRL